MRALLTLVAVFAVTANVSAQAVPASATVPANRLDAHLAAWEARMAEVTTLSTELNRVDTDKVFKSATRYRGWAAYMKSGTGLTALNKAALELKPEGKTEISEKLICTGTYIYQFLPARKEIHAHEMPRGSRGEVADSASLGLMFGMKAAVAKDRFELTLAKEDAHYIYVDVKPRKSEDKTEFQRARLVLDRKTYLPRQVWLEQPNGNEVLWDMPSSAAGVKLDTRYFDAPRAEAGWKIVPVTKSAPGVAEKPRVIRPSAP